MPELWKGCHPHPTHVQRKSRTHISYGCINIHKVCLSKWFILRQTKLQPHLEAKLGCKEVPGTIILKTCRKPALWVDECIHTMPGSLLHIINLEQVEASCSIMYESAHKTQAPGSSK